MKKKDILKYLEYHKSVIESELGKKRDYFGVRDELDNPLKNLYPLVPDLKDEFKIISDEFLKLKKARDISEKYVANHKEEIEQINCEHPILRGSWCDMGYYYHCAFCGEFVSNTNNKVCLVRGYYKDDEDDKFQGELSSFKERREEYNRLCLVINEMLKNKDDNEEIDFTQLFNDEHNKYNIGEVRIDRQKQEDTKYKILLISGSNKIKINDNVFLNKENNHDDSLIKYIKKIDNVDVYQVNNSDYQMINELEEKLSIISKKNIDLVIDLSKLFNYKLIDSDIKIYDVSVDLDKLFPSSTIIKIKSIQDEINLYEKLKEIVLERKGKVYGL